MNEKENAGVELETAPTMESDAPETKSEETLTSTDQPVNEEESATNTDDLKTFTQDQVNDLVRERIDRERKTVYSRYGVEDKNGLDDLVAKAQSYDVMCERIEKARQENEAMVKKLAYLENDVSDDRIGDIEAHFKGKELTLNSETLKQEIATHPEWLKIKQVEDKPTTTIKSISAERGKQVEVDEKAEVAKLFGLERLL